MSKKDLANITLNNKYKFEKRIGSGSYGIVYSANHLFTNKKFAIKIILKNISSNNSNNKQLLINLENNLILQSELPQNNNNLNANLLNLNLIEENGLNCKILKEISLQLRVHKHPNILSIYKVYDTKSCLFVIMDYFPEGDLFNMIVEKKIYANDPFLVKSVFIQLLDAISYCHSKNIYHCDLKPENILVTDNGRKLILADFGLALQNSLIKSNICCGSSYYMAPERLQNFCIGFNSKDAHSIHLERLMINNNNNGHNQDNNSIEEGMHENISFPTAAGDIWSLSIILINLISIRNPWLKASLNDNTFKAFIQNPKILMKILPISNEIYEILVKYLTINPWDRQDLFTFRDDIINCSQLSQQGPLSINSKLNKKVKLELTDSQMFNYDFNSMNNSLDMELLACKAPVDHIKLDKINSKDFNEVEHNYIIDLPLPNDSNAMIRHSPSSHSPEIDIISGPLSLKHDYQIMNKNMLVNGEPAGTTTTTNGNFNSPGKKSLHDKCGSCLTCGFGCFDNEGQTLSQKQSILRAKIFKSKSRHHHNNKYYSVSSNSSTSSQNSNLHEPVSINDLKTHELVNSKMDDVLQQDYDLIFQSDNQYHHQMALNKMRMEYQLHQQQQQQQQETQIHPPQHEQQQQQQQYNQQNSDRSGSNGTAYYSANSPNEVEIQNNGYTYHRKYPVNMNDPNTYHHQQQNPVEVMIHSPLNSRPITPSSNTINATTPANGFDVNVDIVNNSNARSVQLDKNGLDIDISMISIMSVKSTDTESQNNNSNSNSNSRNRDDSINYSIQGDFNPSVNATNNVNNDYHQYMSVDY